MEETDIAIEETGGADPPDRLADKKISGFWQRLLAFLIDCLILSAVGYVLGLALFDFLAHLGIWGRLLGFCMALAYFGYLDSSKNSGQTIGKKIMRIKVVDEEGRYISLNRSLRRFAVLGVPFFLYKALIPLSVAMSTIGFVLGSITYGIGGTIIYLSIFNRRTRQSLHDLLFGTFVVKTSVHGYVDPGLIWKPHMFVVVMWILNCIVSSAFLPHQKQKGIFPELLAIQDKIHDTGQVHMATAVAGKRRHVNNDQKWESTFFYSKIFWKGQPANYKKAAESIAEIILDNFSGIDDTDIISIKISYGYDIGIAKKWLKREFIHSPTEWKEILGYQ